MISLLCLKKNINLNPISDKKTEQTFLRLQISNEILLVYSQLKAMSCYWAQLVKYKSQVFILSLGVYNSGLLFISFLKQTLYKDNSCFFYIREIYISYARGFSLYPKALLRYCFIQGFESQWSSIILRTQTIGRTKQRNKHY